MQVADAVALVLITQVADIFATATHEAHMRRASTRRHLLQYHNLIRVRFRVAWRARTTHSPHISRARSPGSVSVRVRVRRQLRLHGHRSCVRLRMHGR